MLLDPNEIVVLLLLVNSFHVLIKVIINILISVTGIESFQE